MAEPKATEILCNPMMPSYVQEPHGHKKLHKILLPIQKQTLIPIQVDDLSKLLFSFTHLGSYLPLVTQVHKNSCRTSTGAIRAANFTVSHSVCVPASCWADCHDILQCTSHLAAATTEQQFQSVSCPKQISNLTSHILALEVSMNHVHPTGNVKLYCGIVSNKHGSIV